MGSFQDFYTLYHGHSGGGIHAYICESKRKPGVIRIAYRTDKMTRWKICGPIGAKAAEIHLDNLRRNVQRGNGYVAFIHDLKRMQRESIGVRFARHRAALRDRIEMRQSEALPGFGMF